MRHLYILIFGLLLISGTNLKANQILGGGISWEQLGKDTFKVTVTVYRDCNKVSLSATPISAITNCGFMSLSTNKSNGKDITPVCKDQCSRCDNLGCSFQYGIEEYKLTSIMIISNWRKNGCCTVDLSWRQCCRSSQITTIASVQNWSYFEAELNICDTSVNISSPQWNGNPPLISCLGRDLVFDLGATRTNSSDSLVHSFSEPKVSSTAKTTWVSNYSYTKPLYYLGFPKTGLKFPRGIHLDSATGQFMVRPMKVEFTLLTHKVEIYRNGSYVGFMSRETPLIVIKCPDNNPPVLSGINCSQPKPDNFEISFCANNLNQLRVCVSDKDKDDSVKYSYQTTAPGATITWDKTDNRPILFFNWNPSLQDQGKSFKLFVTATDNGCPVPGVTSRTYTLNVIAPVNYTIASFADSCSNGNFFLSKIDSSKISCVSWQHHDQTYEPCQDTPYSDTAVFNFKHPGKKQIQLSFKTKQGCYIVDSIAFEPNTTLTRFINFSDTAVCANDSISLSTKLINPQGPAQITWSTGLNTGSLKSSEKIKLKSIDSIIIVQYQDSVCTGSDTLTVHVNNPPILSFTKKIAVCFADNDTFKFEQNKNFYYDTDTFVEYTWADSNKNEIIKTNDTYFNFPYNGNYFFTATDSLGCSQTDTVNYTLHKPIEDFYLTDSLLCFDQKDTLQVNNLRQGQIKWFSNPINFTNEILSTTNNLSLQIIDTVELGMQYEHFITGCEVNKVVKAYPALPDLPKFIIADSKCANDTFLVATHLTQATWTFENTEKVNPLQVVPFDFGYNNSSMKIEFTGRDSNLCLVEDLVQLQILETPVSKIFVQDTILTNETFFPKPSMKQGLVTDFFWEFGDPVFLKSDLYQPTISLDTVGEFRVKLTLTNRQNNCSTTTIRNKDIVVGWPTSVSSLENYELSIYPNPVSGLLTIENENGLDELYIYDMKGKQVYFNRPNSTIHKIDMQRFPKGLYLLKTRNKQGFAIIRIEKI